MTLTTHAVVGAAAASFFPDQPVFGFLFAFISHFLFDSIPHWDYHLASKESDDFKSLNTDFKIGPAFYQDLKKLSIDLGCGVILVLLAVLLAGETLFSSWWLVGIIGGVMPDFLQVAYTKIRRQPLIWLQCFHMWIHADKRLNSDVVFGIASQAVIVFIAFAFLARFF